MWRRLERAIRSQNRLSYHQNGRGLMYDKRRTLILAAVLLLFNASSAAAVQQRCSGGDHDSDACSSDVDCAGGACVFVHGICDDEGAEGCDCPGGSCNTRIVCSTTAHQFTCDGGDNDGGCCSLRSNCTRDVACVSTQRICVAGDAPGAP